MRAWEGVGVVAGTGTPARSSTTIAPQTVLAKFGEETQMTALIHDAPMLRPRVLVIDDNEVLARSFARMLHRYETLVENDPHVAVARICGGEAFDVVLCDLRMPGMNGLEVLRAIRAHFSSGGGPQVIMMSGSDELSAAALDTPVLLKPCYSTEVRAMVNRLLESRSA
jgi:CheY-like chemotaxis protein